MPDDKVGDVTEGVAGIQKARWWFFQVTFWFGSMAIVRPVWSVYRADSSPGMPYISELSNAGIHAMAGMALLSSLYGMFWDGDAQVRTPSPLTPITPPRPTTAREQPPRRPHPLAHEDAGARLSAIALDSLLGACRRLPARGSS